MHNDEGARFLKEAKKFEKRYDWLRAATSYEKAANLSLKKEASFGTAGLYERIGYCFYRAAMQAETKEQFESRMKLSAGAYERIIGQLQYFNGEEEEEKLDHVKGLYALTKSWIAPDFSKMANLLEEWWKFESKVLIAYEERGDLLSIGRTCNNLLEYSQDRRIFFSAPELFERRQILINIGEKAIAALLKVNDAYELARAYCWTGWYYGLTGNPETHDKWLIYSKKAIALSKDIGDQWLIGWAYNTAWIGSGYYDAEYASSLDYAKIIFKQGKITKDNQMISIGSWITSLISANSTRFEEDPDKQRQTLKKALKWAKQSLTRARLITSPIGILLAQHAYSENLILLASIETHLEEKRGLLEKAVKVGRNSVQYSKGQIWLHARFAQDALSKALLCLANVETNATEKKQLLEEALAYREKDFALKNLKSYHAAQALYNLALIQSELAKMETPQEKRVELFNRAASSMEKCAEIAEKFAEELPDAITNRYMGFYYDVFGRILSQIYKLTKKKSRLADALEIYKKAAEHFDKAALTIHVAECHWQISILHNLLGEHFEGSQSYALAAEAYKVTVEKIPQLKTFCGDYSKYMLAWSEVEKAMHHDSEEEYEESRKRYENAANLFEASIQWSYLAPNYFAWAIMEEAEDLSRKEITQQARIVFQKAREQFAVTEKSIKEKIGEITSGEEKDLALKLLQASVLRRRFCQARIQIEEAKLLDRQGKYLQSAKRYEEAGTEIESILSKIEVETERSKLQLITILCGAWRKMAFAEGKKSPRFFLEAAELFEEAKNLAPTEKASLWALANSSFCKGLAAGIDYQRSLDLKDNALAKGHMKNAAASYFQAGFESAAEHAKATQRLFDAYIFMNQAESEVNPEKRTKQYQMAENLLQIAAGSFVKAKQLGKTDQVQEILATVREEKALAASLNEVMHTPSVTSSTMSFTALSPTNEVSAGLEQFQHANIQANLIAGNKEVKVGESFCLSVEFVNAGKEPALLTRVEDFVPPDFVVVKAPEIYRLEESCLNMKGKQIAPLKLVEAKLVLQPFKKGVYQLKPTVHYLDEAGQAKSLQLKSVEIKVEEIILSDRVSTGIRELDSVLLGGLPKDYAVVLAGSPSDERELIIKNFLKAGTKEGQTSFYVTTEAVGIENLLEKPSFYLFLCNPKPKFDVPDLPNVTKLRSKTDINNLNMALARESRNQQIQQNPKRLCVEIVSDVLLEYGATTTRKWIAELVTDLGSKGFTILAVLDPSMHPSDQANAIINLFDGEISITQSGDLLECKKSVQVKKLRGQNYIKNPICLTKS